MSDSRSSNVFMFDNSDPEMQRACENARENFRYFWREVAWERRRIVPALGLACVKFPFFDGEPNSRARAQGKPQVEQMWLGEVDFDGRFVSGVLLNNPNWLKSVKAGDSARRPLNEISDWMYALGDDVYGAYTVNLMRARMGSQERAGHDGAWGLNFGDPTHIRVVPDLKRWGGFLKAMFGGSGDAGVPEHSMSEAMVQSLKNGLANGPSLLHTKDDRGWTLLHHQALAGSANTVKVLLERGADANAVTDHGMTPLQLAQSLGWDKVIALLVGKGAT